ncbi:hypothetical protein [Helicobacter pylori]|uniref:hypothetical protein n=1 Tax=Helicobacter pylori TaxID=210 RepID=UPI000AE39208
MTFNLKNYLSVLTKNFDLFNICYCENKSPRMQLFTNLNERIINNGLPFGIIFIVGNSDDPIDIDEKTKKLESCFSDERNHVWHHPFTIGQYLILDNLRSCFIFQNDRSFNLKKYLLGLKAKLGFEPMGIFYCENANTHKIELIGNDSDFKGVLLEFSENIPKAPNEISQFLTNFKNSKIPNKEILFSATKKYPSISSYALSDKIKKEVRDTFNRYWWHGYSKIPQEKRITQIKKQVSEECKVNPFFHSWRVSSEQNRKVNKIAEDLKSGKIVGEKIIDNIFDINASYCFITPEDLKNLKERLFIQQDIDITHVINQKKGEAFDHILINDIKYNLLDNTFHFIFNVGNSLLKESSQLIIEVPREALDLENVDRLIENTLSSHRVCFCSEIHSVCSENSLICHLNQGSYIIDLHLIDD